MEHEAPAYCCPEQEQTRVAQETQETWETRQTWVTRVTRNTCLPVLQGKAEKSKAFVLTHLKIIFLPMQTCLFEPFTGCVLTNYQEHCSRSTRPQLKKMLMEHM